MPNELELILMVAESEIDPRITGNFDFTISVDAVDLIRDQPIVGLLEGAVGSINDLLISTQAICERLGFFSSRSCAPGSSSPLPCLPTAPVRWVARR